VFFNADGFPLYVRVANSCSCGNGGMKKSVAVW
jgi:hypothetical protein